MRKEALAISSDVDNLARRKQKLLDRKRKRESKGKAVAIDQPPKDESVDIATDHDVAMLKAVQEDIPIASHDPFAEERIHLSFPLDGSFFSEPKDLLEEVRKCLLPEDEKRFLSLGHRKAAERSLLQAFQVIVPIPFYFVYNLLMTK